jgi:hypothetical protein
MPEIDPRLVVIVIIAHKAEISREEAASLRQCYAVLGKYSIRLICPQGLNVSAYKTIIPDAEIEFIDPKWQSDYRMFNRLKIEPLLYEKFRDYKFMMYYELDAWVFADEMEKWCAMEYDYIGSPWIEKMENGKPEFYPYGGNGGFSLRRISACLHVWSVWKTMKTRSEIWEYHKQFHGAFGLFLRMPLILLRMAGLGNNSKHYMKKTAENEDFFWCKTAPKIDPSFKVAPAETGMQFSFEKHPSVLYRMNGEKLPFGCHAWCKYEPEFWANFIHIS